MSPTPETYKGFAAFGEALQKEQREREEAARKEREKRDMAEKQPRCH